MNCSDILDFFGRIHGEVQSYGLDLHLQIGWLGLVLGLLISALIINRAFPNLKRAHLLFSKKEVVAKSA